VDHQRTDKDYLSCFHCLPVHLTFCPPPVTPPLVAGVVTGIVIGPPGEAKHVDQFGRVKIRFPWRNPAHSNPNDPGDGGYVRVAQIATWPSVATDDGSFPLRAADIG
jgi:type VI secretion system secreted protein VgrG